MKKSFGLDLTLVMGQCLLDRHRLGLAQETLREFAPAWVSKLRPWPPSQGLPTLIDLSAEDALFEAVQASLSAKGQLHSRLQRVFAQQTPARLTGVVELRGANTSLTIVLAIDEQLLLRSGPRWLWGNRLVLQVRRRQIDGVMASDWAKSVFSAFCERLGPWYAHAGLVEEYSAKNLVQDDGGMKAVGVDARAGFPGLYWLNYFGGPYQELLGQRNLLTSPGVRVDEIGEGVALRVGDEPEDWDTEARKSSERLVVDHLGSHLFFSKELARATSRIPFIEDLIGGYTDQLK